MVVPKIDWSLLFGLFLALWQSRTHGQSSNSVQRFYLRLEKNQDELTRADCENATAENTCLRQPEKDLRCMCEDEHEETEALRERCAADGRNETTVQLLERKNLPDMLGVCARAFASLGYVVHIVNISDDNAENSTSCYTIDSLYEKIAELGNYSTDFRKLLDRTIVGVYLSSDQQRDICKDAYNEWLCSTSLSLYNDTGKDVKPCLGVCTRVVQECPYYLPSKFQEQADGETIYGGYPIFDCPDMRILEYYSRHCGTNCSIPYHLGGDHCIGRNRAAPVQTCAYCMLLLSLLLTIGHNYWTS